MVAVHGSEYDAAMNSVPHGSLDDPKVASCGETLVRLLSLLYEMSSLVPEAGQVEESLRTRLHKARQHVLGQAEEEGIAFQQLHSSSTFVRLSLCTTHTAAAAALPAFFA
jgi:hypothetical protein